MKFNRKILKKIKKNKMIPLQMKMRKKNKQKNQKKEVLWED